ncbi:response regulator [Chryseolinea lacunae]|uniref:histidine kinase n=1 Tax=Chryseolinea lacunae TaxID=2801331 RepID=A0ABS1L420_9BACT|nr:response regulator [Chryseolinea lacunae]MBL0745311.1 response regulator [Chryseolinea lacunae]
MKTTYKRNLIIGFGVSLLILMISSVASYISIRNLLDSSNWVNHTHAVILELNDVMSALKDAETGQRGYLLTGEKDYQEPYKAAQAVADRALDNVQALTLDNTAQQKGIEDLRRLVTKRFTILQRVIDHRDSVGTLQIKDLRMGKDYMDSVRSLMTSMREREEALLKERTSRMETFSNFTPVLIVTAAVIALLITIAFYVRVRNDFEEKAILQRELEAKEKDISTRIGIIRGIADKVAAGDYGIRVDDQQSDALGNVAGSLNKMASSLQESFVQLSDKEWLQAGIAGLNDVMIGEKTLQALTNQVIEFVSSYSQSQVGALYILERDELQVFAGYAYMPDKSRARFKIGEGLVGQAVSTGKLMELKDVPEESIYISFTTGQARPRHIVAIPLYDGYTIKGALEVASLHTFTTRDLEFLRTSAANIGVSISTAQNRKRMQELLEETQSQTEELQAQHSELEHVNSELEVQTEKLQASEEELKVQQEELRQANQELEERSRMLEDRNELITERNLEIQAKAEQLAQTTRYKSEFLANMSHELRTPLNSILLLSRLMSENPEKNLNTDQVEYARVIQSSGNGLLSLIDEILDLSKIESGKMRLEYSQVSVQEIIEEMQGVFHPMAKVKGIEFLTTVAKDVPEKIETDKLRLVQILRNLLSNALKFTANGYVSLDVAKEGKDMFMLRIAVKDTGIGVPLEKQQLIFEAFQQADGSTRRKYGGTGLGLSISRELAKLLGGEIRMKSEVGKGSEFILNIPLSQPQGKPETFTNSLSDLLTSDPLQCNRPKTDAKYISTSIPENIPDDRAVIKTDDKVILIVEDDTNFAKSLLDFTRRRGYKGIVAVRGDEGIALAREFSPVGILLDIQLPVKSGWEVMDELKANAYTRHIPVHIMSSHEGKSESLHKGAVDFINKPVAYEKMQEIFQKIEYVLTHHPKKVLIVEENPQHAKALGYFLETFDISLEIRNDVQEAIALLKSKDTDCVILDMGMPDQKSYETLEQVRSTPGLENVPVIIFTGQNLSRAEELRMKQYADSIVIKTAHSYKRIYDEVSLFLHLMEKKESPNAKPRYHKLGELDEVLKGKTVLIADDDVRNIFSLTKAMENYMMNVITAVDGKDALKQLQASPNVDIVLMDMMMPEMDGYESTTAIRNDPRLKNIPVIAVTAKAMAGDRAKCISAGASDYISKPVDIDQLLSLLRVWLYERGTTKR